jgi:hypothetical protein
MDSKTDPKPARVLRAGDVIPPFENDDASSAGQTGRDGVPTFDLAESILAEQRRIATAKRRRANHAPTRQTGKSECGRASVPARLDVSCEDARPALVQPYDLAELHQIVAGIVSRDIERLCTGPSVAL